MTDLSTTLHSTILNEEGFPLLMLHGWGHSHESLRALGELLTPHAQVHLLDLPGFGQSEVPPTNWSSFDYADRLISYLDEKKIPQVDLLGHSFGGKVALSLAIRYPTRIRRLILLASSGLGPKRSLSKKIRITSIRWIGKAIKKWDSSLHAKYIQRFASIDYQKAGPMRSILVRSVNEDLSLLIKKIDCPTLLLWGEQDQDTPIEMAKRLKTLIPHSKLHILPYKQHLLFQDVGAHLCAFHSISFLRAVL